MATLNGDRRFNQNVIVMRHGDRLDNFDVFWTNTADRPWDPPLVHEGKIRAFSTGRTFRTNFNFPVHRVFVSPFLRCLQTASEVVSALCAADSDIDDPEKSSSADVTIDPSKIKASIEYGLSEMMNNIAIRAAVAPKDRDFKFVTETCEAVLPSGTVDPTAEKVYEKLPQWEEKVHSARSRYVDVIKGLADKYPTENLLFVTHGEAVGSVFSAFVKDAVVYDVKYCGYSYLKRTVDLEENKPFKLGDFALEAQFGIKCTKGT